MAITRKSRAVASKLMKLRGQLFRIELALSALQVTFWAALLVGSAGAAVMVFRRRRSAGEPSADAADFGSSTEADVPSADAVSP